MKHKKFVVLGLAASLSISGSLIAAAEQTRTIYRDHIMVTLYDYSNEWVWRDPDQDGIEECYYFYENGEQASRELTPDNYMTNAEGAWVQDGTVQQRHVSDGSPINVSVYEDKANGKKVFNIEGVEITAEIPASTSFTWVRGGWIGDPGVGEPTGTNYCTVDDINFYQCSYETLYNEGSKQKVLAVTFIINGEMTERNNPQTGYVGGHYKFFDTATKQEYQKTLGGDQNSFISAKATLEDTIYNHVTTEDLAVGEEYFTDLTVCIPVGVNACTLEFY